MKIYALLALCTSCYAGDQHNQTVSTNVTITQPTKTLHPRAGVARKAGEKHPDVIAAHERIQARDLADDATVTCCCFLKARKK